MFLIWWDPLILEETFDHKYVLNSDGTEATDDISTDWANLGLFYYLVLPEEEGKQQGSTEDWKPGESVSADGYMQKSWENETGGIIET